MRCGAAMSSEDAKSADMNTKRATTGLLLARIAEPTASVRIIAILDISVVAHAGMAAQHQAEIITGRVN